MGKTVGKVMAGRMMMLLGIALIALPLCAQDESPSLGDVARQARQQKLQKDSANAQSPSAPKDPPPQPDAGKVPAATTTSKDTQPKDSQAAKASKRVVTNDEIPEHAGPSSISKSASHTPDNSSANLPFGGPDNSAAAEQWKQSISRVKTFIANMQQQIINTEDSIRYTGTNCVTGCAQWNEAQKRKQDEVDMMKQQVEQQQKQLEAMQEQARQQGFGSSVYDPE
jgi:hypothetical protein